MFPASAPSQGEAQALTLASSSPKGAEPKNSLIQYCRKSCLPMPMFQVVNEGSCHAPKFRCTVLVHGKSFASPNTFLQRRAAEQDAAKLALEQLSPVNRTTSSIDLRKLVSQDKSLCKMIVYELAVKMNLGRCTYETLEVKEHSFPMFVSSLVLNGTHYKGNFGKSKKEAEQLAAHAAILSLLGDPTYAASLSEVIMPKLNPYAAFLGKDFERNISVSNKAVKIAAVDNNILTPLKKQAAALEQSSSRVMVNNNMFEVANSEAETEGPGGSQVLANNLGDSGVLCSSGNIPDIVNSQDKTKEQAGHGVLAHELGSSLVVADKQGDFGVLDTETMPEMANSQAKAKEQVGHGVLAGEQEGSWVVADKQTDSAVLGNKNMAEMVNSQAKTNEQVGHGILDHEQGGSGVVADDTETVSTEASCNALVTVPLKLCNEMHPSLHESQLQHSDTSISQLIGFPSQDSVSRSSKRRRRKRKNKTNKRLQTENNDSTDVTQMP